MKEGTYHWWPSNFHCGIPGHFYILMKNANGTGGRGFDDLVPIVFFTQVAIVEELKWEKPKTSPVGTLKLVLKLNWPVRLILIKAAVKSLDGTWIEHARFVGIPTRLFTGGEPMFCVFIHFISISVPNIQPWIARHIKPTPAKEDLCWVVLGAEGPLWIHLVLAVHLNGPSIRE